MQSESCRIIDGCLYDCHNHHHHNDNHLEDNNDHHLEDFNDHHLEDNNDHRQDYLSLNLGRGEDSGLALQLVQSRY